MSLNGRNGIQMKEEVEGDEQPGCLVTVKTDENVEKMRAFI
jgi:hypothetical protein